MKVGERVHVGVRKRRELMFKGSNCSSRRTMVVC